MIWRKHSGRKLINEERNYTYHKDIAGKYIHHLLFLVP